MANTTTTIRPNNDGGVGPGAGSVVGAANLTTAVTDNSDSSYGQTVYASGDAQTVYYFGSFPGSRVLQYVVTTSGSPTLTSGYGQFSPADVGATISGTGIPGGTTILSVTNQGTITMSANATVTATFNSATVSNAFWTLPAQASVKSVTFRARVSAPSGTGLGATMTGNVDPALGPYDTFPLGTPIVDIVGSTLSVTAYGAPFTAADVAFLQQRLNPNAAVTLNWYEAYADIAYNQAPVVTVTLPSAGFVITPTPTVTWTYYDPESDLQERYWIKVFDAATYGAVGFDPETAIAAWDSTELLGAATSAVVGAQLVNSTTFKAYVKVSDQGSSGRYSAWVAGPAWTTRVQFPAAPVVVSATPDPTLNRVAIVLQGQDNELTRNMASAETGVVGVEADTNLATTFTVADGVTVNASAAITSATASWQSSDIGKTISGTGIPGATTILSVQSPTNATMSANATASASGVTFTIGRSFPWRTVLQAAEGAGSFLMRSAAAGDMVMRTAAGSIGVMVPVKALLQYTALASFRAATTTRSARVEVFWYQASGVASSVRASDNGSSVSATSAAFIQSSVTAVAPSDAAFAVVKARVLATAAAGENFYVDQLDLGPGPSTTWTRGGFVQGYGAVADTFNRPDSAVSMGQLNSGNLLPINTASIETDATGWVAVTNCGAPGRTTAQFLDGLAALVLTSTAGGDMSAAIATRVPVNAGQAYTAMASFKSAVSARSVRVDVSWFDVSAVIIGTPVLGSTIADTTTGWTQAFVTATAPAGAITALVTINVLATGGAAEVHWMDAAGIRAGTSPVWSPPYTWVGQGGAVYGIQNNHAYYVSGGTVAAVSTAVSLPDVTDGTLTCDVTMGLSGNVECGLLIRGSDSANFLAVLLHKDASANSVALFKYVGAVATTIGAAVTNVGIVNNGTYGVKVEFFGPRIVVSIDKKDGGGYLKLIDAILSAADLQYFAGPLNIRYGIFMTVAISNTFDNFVVTPVTSQRAIVERSTDGGVTWTTVRSINRVDLTDPGQQGTFYDYEAPRALPLRYRAKITATEVDITTIGAPSAAVLMAPNLLGDSFSWLKSPSDPTKNMVVPLLKDSVDSVSPEDMTIFEPLGRFDPLIHRGTIRAESFDGLSFLFSNDATWAAFEALRARQEPLLLQTCYGDTLGYEQFWVVLGPDRAVHRLTSDDMATATKRQVKIPARQVLAPTVS